MTSVRMNTTSTKEDQKEKMLSPSEEESPPVLSETSATVNFSELTPSQFGISVQSFTPASLSNGKDKSRLAQIKLRRRSNVGVRGSPETNSLIRFMAQQRMKTPPLSQTPELVRNSPFLPRVASTLRQKMASFQSVMDVEESEVCDPMPRQDGNTGGCIKTRDYLSDGTSHNGKENHPPRVTPLPSKRRRLGPLEGCQVEIREASSLRFSLKEQEEEEEPAAQLVTRGRPSSEAVEEAQAVLISPPHHAHLVLQAPHQQEGVFELQSLSWSPPDDPAATSPAQPASPVHITPLPSLLELEPTGDNSSGTSTVKKKKKKRVHFGGPLSPEFFDKTLPPSTPLQKGGTPARAPTPGGRLQPRSVLKTPQGSDSQTPRAQPDLSSPTVFASPTLPPPRSCRRHSQGDDDGEKDGGGMIVFPSMEDTDFAVTRDAECTLDAQPLNLDTAFSEESLSQSLAESETKTSTTSLMDALDEATTSLPEEEEQHEADVKAPAPTKRRRKKEPKPENSSSSEAAACSSSRKRKPMESEPPKRSTRSAAKSASGKMKICAAPTRWKKNVDRSLYGSRTYASKNPDLSPITERLSLLSQNSPSTSCTGPNQETHVEPDLPNDTQVTGNQTMVNLLVTSLSSHKNGGPAKGRRLSRPSVKGTGLKKRRVRVPDSTLSEETPDLTEQHCDRSATTSPEALNTVPVHTAQAPTHTDTHCTDSDGKLESLGSLDDCPPPGEHSSYSLNQREAKQDGSSSENSLPLQEHGNQTSHEEEGGEREEAASQQRSPVRTSSDDQEDGGVVGLELAPWQADFNFEDVFKPVATRGQRSVRRSLRNRHYPENNSAGLAWLAWTSPESTKEARRKTRGRRLSALLPEETADNTS